TCRKPHTQHRCFSRLDDAWRAEFGDEAERPRWAELLRSGVAIFDLDYDAILAAMYALSVSAEGDCYLSVPPDPGKEAASLGASESALSGIAPAEALHTFTLDSGASLCFFRDSTTLTPLSAPVPVRLADPSGGQVLARSFTTLPCPAVPSGSLSGLHLPSFSLKFMSTSALHDAMVTATTPGGQRVSICTCTPTGRHPATFTHRPGSSLYTLATEPPQVAVPSQVFSSGPVAPPFSCRLLSHLTLMWHALLPPCLWSSQVSSSPPVLACPALPSLRRGATACRSSLLLVSPDNCSSADSPHGLRLQLRERFHPDLRVLGLHSDKGGEFSSDLLWGFCRGEGILQSFMLPASPHQNGIAEHRIGLVMEVARTSMIHAAAPHFPWQFAVRYAAHQLNLWPRVSLSVMHWGSGSGALVPLFAIRLRTSSPPAPFLASFLAFPLKRLAGSFTTPPRVVSSPLWMSCLTSVSQVDPLLGTVPFEVAVGSGAAPGAASAGAKPGGSESEGAESGGFEPEGAEPGSAEPAGVEPGGAKHEGVEPGGAESEGAESGGAEPRGTSSSGGPTGALLRLLPRLVSYLVHHDFFFLPEARLALCLKRASCSPPVAEPSPLVTALPLPPGRGPTLLPPQLRPCLLRPSRPCPAPAP
ncbi:unnamed protein product, partial [Closterium sp. NIES-54]